MDYAPLTSEDLGGEAERGAAQRLRDLTQYRPQLPPLFSDATARAGNRFAFDQRDNVVGLPEGHSRPVYVVHVHVVGEAESPERRLRLAILRASRPAQDSENRKQSSWRALA